MKRSQIILSVSLVLASLILQPVLATRTNAQQQSTSVEQQQQTIGALQRGYRTGYSDGYPAGFKDSTDGAAREFRNRQDYQRADRAYAESYGTLEDYQDGYRQGFEVGYAAGYDRRSFDSTIPANLSRRGTLASSSTQNTDNDATTTASNSNGRTVVIPSNTVFLVELLTNLSTESSQRGDRFQARVLEPIEYQGAMIDGRVTRVKRPGRIRGTSELQLAFEQIRLTDNRWTNINAQIIEVVGARDDGVGEVDTEGGVRGRDTTKDDVARIGAASGVGAVLGAIFGGGKGAAIGAAIGGAVSTGGVLTTRGKEILLPRGQRLKVRTSSETSLP